VTHSIYRTQPPDDPDMFAPLTPEENMELWFHVQRAGRKFDRLSGFMQWLGANTVTDRQWDSVFGTWLETIGICDDLTIASYGRGEPQ
jgi:hypothetical protein